MSQLDCPRPSAALDALRALTVRNYAREHWMQPDEHPPVGLILCTDKNDALARYAMEGLGRKLLVREYLTALPKESALAAEVARTRELLERQAELRRRGSISPR